MAEPQPRSEQDVPQIDWDSARVSDARLEVEVAGELPKHWRARFEQVLEQLQRASHGERRWGEIKVRKRAISVTGVAEGGEGDLRHLLDSVVLQAGAPASENGGKAHEPHSSPGQERDERLTSAFRSFGSQD